VLDLARAVTAGPSAWPSWRRLIRLVTGTLGLKNAAQFAVIFCCVGVLRADALGLVAGVVAGAELAEAEAAGLCVAAGAGLLLPQAATPAHRAHARTACRTYT
jgi:hypothetical protein